MKQLQARKLSPGLSVLIAGVVFIMLSGGTVTALSISADNSPVAPHTAPQNSSTGPISGSSQPNGLNAHPASQGITPNVASPDYFTGQVSYVKLPSIPTSEAYDSATGNMLIVSGTSSSGSVGVLSANGTVLLRSIGVGSEPKISAFDSGDGYLYVPNYVSDSVSILNSTTVEATISLSESGPASAVYDPSNGYVYIFESSGYISSISGTTLEHTFSSVAFTTPVNATYDPASAQVFFDCPLVDGYTNVLCYISGNSITTDLIPSDQNPALYDPADHDLYIPSLNPAEITVLNSQDSVVATLKSGTGLWTSGAPLNLTYNSATDEVYASVGSVGTGGAVLIVSGSTIEDFVTESAPLQTQAVSYYSALAQTVLFASGSSGKGFTLAGESLEGTFTFYTDAYIGVTPTMLVYDPANGYGIALISGSVDVAILSSTSIASEASPTPGSTPLYAAFDPENGYTYVTNEGSNTVSVFYGAESIGTPLSVGSEPYWDVYDPYNGYVYVANQGSATVSAISGDTVVDASIGVGTGSVPLRMAVNPYNGDVFVPNSADQDYVSVISGTSVTDVTTCSAPHSATFDPHNRYVYVPCYNGGVSILSGTGSFMTTVTVQSMPMWAAWDPTNNFVYISNTGSSSVSIISNTTVEGAVEVGEDPWLPVFDYTNGGMYVPNSGSGTVTALWGGYKSPGASWLTVGSDPTFGAYDPADGLVYFPNYDSSTVSVLSTYSVLNISVGSEPKSVMFDPVNATIYVMNSGSSTVNILGAPVAIIGGWTGGTLSGEFSVFDAAGECSVTFTETLDVNSQDRISVSTGTQDTWSFVLTPTFQPIKHTSGSCANWNAPSSSVNVGTVYDFNDAPGHDYSWSVSTSLCSNIPFYTQCYSDSMSWLINDFSDSNAVTEMSSSGSQSFSINEDSIAEVLSEFLGDA